MPSLSDALEGPKDSAPRIEAKQDSIDTDDTNFDEDEEKVDYDGSYHDSGDDNDGVRDAAVGAATTTGQSARNEQMVSAARVTRYGYAWERSSTSTLKIRHQRTSQFIIRLNKHMEAVNNSFTIGMKFKMVFEGEDPPERRLPCMCNQKAYLLSGKILSSVR
ncbi:hypothetical protein R6Q59_013576 [Mikania micrantha]